MSCGVSVINLQILLVLTFVAVFRLRLAHGVLVAVYGLDVVLKYGTSTATAKRGPQPQHRILGYAPDCSLSPVDFAFPVTMLPTKEKESL